MLSRNGKNCNFNLMDSSDMHAMYTMHIDKTFSSDVISNLQVLWDQQGDGFDCATRQV